MDDIVRDLYNRNADREWNRLAEPLQRVEFESTLRLVDGYFPATGKVCDIGSGPGRYAIELAQRGHRVSLLDVASQLLDKARTHSASRD
jgi:S-adenosylmethionine-dependent methyltransferase